MNAAIYRRVSTDSQEREGTSLQTQFEACHKYCLERGYQVSHDFCEAYSGLSLERPELTMLRELARSESIDRLVCYSLDRLTRDPVHGVILTQELEKYGVVLETVTEPLENSEIGKLMNYIRSYASKIEAEKIKERSVRGRRARARQGRIPGGNGINLYGYDYIPVTQKDGGRRVINEIQAVWVRRMFQWLVYDGLSTSAITIRLQAMSAPTRSGKPWNRSSVLALLTNLAFTGRTFVFTCKKGGKQFSRPESDWIEIEGVTPAIISEELFNEAQRQLQANRAKTMPQTKHEYLLRGHLRCRQCGYAYTGAFSAQRFYRCTSKVKTQPPHHKCANKTWRADKLEGLVWSELERYLSNRDLIVSQLEKLRSEAGQVNTFEAELQHVESELKTAEQEQRRLLQWALKGFPENQVEAENRRLNKVKELLKARRAELVSQIKASQQAIENIPDLECFIENIQKSLPELDFEGRRLALDMLGITVYVDGHNVEVAGVIEPEQAVSPCLNDLTHL